MPSTLALNDTIISQLAREIARNLYPTATVREQFKLTVEEFDEAVETPYFQTRLAEEVALWNDPQNAKARVKAKMSTMIEESMPEMYRLLHDPTQPMSGKVAFLQMACRFIDDNPNVTGGSDADRRVRITINIDGKALSYEKQQAKVVDAEYVQLEERHGEREAHREDRHQPQPQGAEGQPR